VGSSEVREGISTQNGSWQHISSFKKRGGEDTEGVEGKKKYCAEGRKKTVEIWGEGGYGISEESGGKRGGGSKGMLNKFTQFPFGRFWVGKGIME